MRTNRKWTNQELDTLSDYYGLVPDAHLAAFLGRTVTAVRLAAKRRLKICHQANFFTARRLADELGIG